MCTACRTACAGSLQAARGVPPPQGPGLADDAHPLQQDCDGTRSSACAAHGGAAALPHHPPQHNEAKRLRAENRELQEQKACLELEETANTLRYKLAEQEAVRDGQSLQLARYARYNEFMQEVQAASPEEYSDIPAIENRYAMLQSAIRAAEADMEVRKAEVTAEMGALGRLRGALERSKLDLQNEFDVLKQAHDAIKERADELVAATDAASSAKGHKLLEFGQVLQTVGHLHTRCMGSRHREHIKHKPRPVTDEDLLYGRVALPPPAGGVSPAAPPATAAGGAASGASLPSAAPTGSGARRAHPAIAAMLAAGRRHTRGAGAASEEELARARDFAALKGDVVSAMQQLEVVGNYIHDFQRLVARWEGGERHTWKASGLASAPSDGAGLVSPMATGRPPRGAGGAAGTAAALESSRGGGALGASAPLRSSARASAVRGVEASRRAGGSSSRAAGSGGGGEWALARPGGGEASLGVSSMMASASAGM